MAGDPFQAPTKRDGTDPLDDPSAAVPGLVERASGALSLAAGGTLVTAAIQLGTFFWLTSGQLLAAVGLFGLGLALLGLGPSVMKGRLSATLAVTGLAATATLYSGGWLLYAFVYGASLSFLVLFAVGISAVVTLLAALAIGPSSRVTAARRRLYE